jgi:hypothetical protein
VLLTWSWKRRPTREQHRLLERALEQQRQLYNAALEERIGAWRNRAIADAGMAKLVQMLTYKAERSGGRLVRVDARHTSQDCSGCGVRVAKPLAQRTHACGACGLAVDGLERGQEHPGARTAQGTRGGRNPRGA